MMLPIFAIATSTLAAQAIQEGSPLQPNSRSAPQQQAASSQATPRQTAAVGQSASLPIRRIALFSSGVGFFEHSGSLSGAAAISLVFNANAVDDALKSLAINDPASASPSVTYPSEETLYRTLRSLKIDLSANPSIANILAGSRGAEIDIYAPTLISGRVLGVESRGAGQRDADYNRVEESFLSILTSQGIKTIGVKDIASFSFKDPAINADLNRALDLIFASRSLDSRTLLVNLDGGGARDASISYVISAPVWKASYRLDLAQKKPLLQGWAIVDNDSDTDWNNVELSLVTGRPVSFIQRLYAPYRLFRPTLPLAIAGSAEARSYDSGWAEADTAEAPQAFAESAEADRLIMMKKSPGVAYDETYVPSAAPMPRATDSLGGGGNVETAAGRNAGDQFEFTIKKPVSLARQQSAMLPLVESTIQAEKVLVFSGAKAERGGLVNPSISAELVNTSGMKLPAGPITVYDGGTYAGDALLGFFPENEKRLISYGDDLSVSGSVTSASSRTVVSVAVAQGVMTINRKQSYEKTYTIKNASADQKKLIIEHQITYGTTLAAPASFDERTDAVYRFARSLPANNTLTFTVKEENPISERIVLAQLRLDSFVSYASNQEIPANVRAALQKAVDLKKKADEAKAALTDAQTGLTRLTAEQDRVRQNLQAAGNQTPQGQDYLKKLSSLDASIDGQNKAIDDAKAAAQASQSEYDRYVGGLQL
jgi:hypothetical protein